MKCDHYDYIEIACMFKYPIVLKLTSGEEISATAIDTSLNEQRQECIKIDTEVGFRLIVLDTIASLKITVNNPHFEHIQFL
jgi:Rho-binding antiterminator